MAQIQFKGKSFVQNHHLLVKYHELIPKQDKSLTDMVSLHDNLIIHLGNPINKWCFKGNILKLTEKEKQKIIELIQAGKAIPNQATLMQKPTNN